MMLKWHVLLLAVSLQLSGTSWGDEAETARGDRLAAEYFEQETTRLAEACMADATSLERWQQQREVYRTQLLEMLGLQPLPERTDLAATVTGISERDEFVVERVHFQSRPGLYVTGNLYRPREVTEPLPAVLYVCGHGRVAKDGVSYGNKAHYQHHGAWFARNGYVCLTIDTLQLGEIEGIHHGTHRYDRWWWLNRGYTPAGVEAWNCVRALDYLETRPEVDPQRMGVTGRSGGGAYSWWIAAIDERVKAAVPVAGITDLENHVVDGCVEGHCDCMFMVNTYQWDYPLLAALVAPRPLLISNTDSDRIFPLDGVVRTFEQVRKIYRLYDAEDKVGLNIAAGPHRDLQELRVHAFRWLNQHLKGDDSLIEMAAVPFFEPEELKVFEQLPTDELNTRIDETFVAAAENPLPKDAAQWRQQREQWMAELHAKTFRGWPDEAAPLRTEEVLRAEQDGITLRCVDFDSQSPYRLRLYLLHPSSQPAPELVVLHALDDPQWRQFLAMLRVGFEKHAAQEGTLPPADAEAYAQLREMLSQHAWCMAYVAPRGVGPTAWDSGQRPQVQHRRRYYLLGQTLDGMQIYDLRRAIQAVREQPQLATAPLWLEGRGAMAGQALYASLFEPEIARLDLYEVPSSHRDGPYLLNISRILDLPQAVALAAEQSQVVIYGDADPWRYPQTVAERLGWQSRQLEFRRPPQ